MFRCEDGRIIEHWDVIQEIPADNINPLGMF
jgi:predicted SnoaL-like aldol condensation-catalyzing enzyme